MPKNLFIIILIAIFFGCAPYNTAGRRFDTTAIDRIELGKTTESEVIAMLGAPKSISKLQNGIIVYYYVYGDMSGFMAKNAIDSLQIQLYNGVVINKYQISAH